MTPNSSSCLDFDSIFLVGRSVPYDPAKEVYRNMLRLVAYDVADARRLRKVAKICESFGIRIEYSVFECDLDEKQFAAFWQQLRKSIDEKEDRLIAYRICGSCVGGIQSCGVARRSAKVLLYMI